MVKRMKYDRSSESLGSVPNIFYLNPFTNTILLNYKIILTIFKRNCYMKSSLQ